jgi:hypothetical protein
LDSYPILIFHLDLTKVNHTLVLHEVLLVLVLMLEYYQEFRWKEIIHHEDKRIDLQQLQ